MKKLLLLIAVLIPIIAASQRKTIFSPAFTENKTALDTIIKIYDDDLDSIELATQYRLKQYYVPYDSAFRNVDLGEYEIRAKGQLIPLSNGACIVPTITDNGNGSITVGQGEYHLSSNENGKGTHNYIIAGGTFTLTDNVSNYLVADYNGGTPIIKVITDVTLINETTIVPVYTAFRNGNYLHFQNWDALGVALANKVHQSIVKTQRYRRESGLALSEYGTHNLALTTGRVWTGAVPISLDAIATATDNLFFFRHVAGVWTLNVQTTYNFTHYDNGTDLIELTANGYAINWVFRGVENQKHLYIVSGVGDYTESQAISATLPAIPIAISSHAVLVAKLIVQKNAATALSIQSAFDTQFGLSAIQSHGDLTGRDVVDSHPAGAITNTPYATIEAISTQLAINELTDEKVQVSPASAQLGDIWMNGSASFSGNLFMGSLALMNSTYKSGLHQDVGGEIIEFGTNVSQLGVGNYNEAHSGALFRIDTRSGLEGQLFSIIYQPIPGSSDNSIFQVGTSGNLTLFGNVYAGADIGARINAFGTSHGIYGKAGSAGSWGGVFKSNDETKEVDLGNDSYAIVATGAVKLNSLASTNPQLLSHSSDGTLTPIPNGTGTIKNNGSGVFTYINDAVQSLTGTTPTYNVDAGTDATITISGNTSFSMQNLVAGMSGTIYITNPVTVYKIKFLGYNLNVAANLTYDANGITLKGLSIPQSIGWKYIGGVLLIHGTYYNAITY